jgi:hypothetical protein
MKLVRRDLFGCSNNDILQSAKHNDLVGTVLKTIFYAFFSLVILSGLEMGVGVIHLAPELLSRAISDL